MAVVDRFAEAVLKCDMPEFGAEMAPEAMHPAYVAHRIGRLSIAHASGNCVRLLADWQMLVNCAKRHLLGASVAFDCWPVVLPQAPSLRLA